jgi:glycosyltransferase involved in cell wall biosynthesis
MIRIAFLIDTIGTPTAGTEKQLLLLLKTLSRERITPFLCCLRSSEWLEREFNECELVNLNISSYRDLRFPSRLRRFSSFLRGQYIDIVQTHFRDSNYIGILAARLAGTAAVISSRRGEPYWRNSLELSLLRLFDRGVHTFVANSRSSADFFCSHEGIPAAKMSVISNGIDVEQFAFTEEQRAAVRAQLGIDPGTWLVGIVANLRPVKGIDVFLRAAALVKKKLRQVRFLIAGDGEAKTDLMRVARALDLESDVLFLGSRQDVPRLLAAFDIGVLSSNYESFSNAIVEYEAAALPVVCTDVGGAREAIVDGMTGYLVPAGDAQALADRIGQLLTSTSLRGMGALGRKRASELFSIGATARSYEKLYLQVMDSSRSRPLSAEAAPNATACPASGAEQTVRSASRSK